MDRYRDRVSGSGRVEAFSDGVFAIAITLLVLDLREPTSSTTFLSDLGEQWPSYVAYVAAFTVLGLVWLSHHDLFSRIESANASLLLRNLLLLFVASLFSFPTAILAAAFRDSGSRLNQIAAVGIYSAASVALALTWLYLARTPLGSPQLARDPADAAVHARGQGLRTLAICVLSLLSFGVAFIQPTAGIVVLAVIPVVSLGFYRHSQQEHEQRKDQEAAR